MEVGHYRILAAYYASYFAIIGVWLPYWPLYLSHQLGFGPAEIGLLTALALGIKVAGPPVWGAMADRGSRHGVLVGTSWATLLAFALFLPAHGLTAMVAITILYSFFHAGPLALVEATTMEQVVRHGGDYGRIRLWGSLGFIVLALGLGPLTDLWGLLLVPVAILLLHGGCALLAHRMPAAETVPVEAGGGGTGVLAHAGVGWFYLSTLLMQFSHAAYYGFFSLHLEQNGYSRTLIGLLWSLGVIAEVLLLSHSRWLLERVGVSLVLSGSLLLATARWALYGVTVWWPLLVVGQTLHAFTFGAFHVAAIRRTHEAAPPGARATAQAWYGAFSFGIGGGLGLLISGRLYEVVGAGPLFALMAVAAALGALASLWAARHFQPRYP